MVNIPAPTHASEEWPDADFEFPEGDNIAPPQAGGWDKGEDEDWDMEMDLGKTGGAKALSVAQVSPLRRSSFAKGTMVTIHPPLTTTSENTSPEDGDDDEGISTIKLSELPPTLLHRTSISGTILDEDMEADFSLPSDLTQLSLRPLSLHHRGSKASLEWGDRDHTSSSTCSSDAYSSLGFHPSNNSTSLSLPDTDDDFNFDDDGDLDGLVIPTGLFESNQGRKHLTKILDLKKKFPVIEEKDTVAPQNPEEDFEIGLVINGDDDLSPSKFAQTQETKRTAKPGLRSNSAPLRPSTAPRPPSRLKADRPKTPADQLGSTSRSVSRTSTSPPLRPSASRRAQTFQTLPSQTAQAPSSFVAPKQGQIRGQKSHGILKSISPTNSRKLNRKASLSSLLETSNSQEPPSAVEPSQQPRGYSATTAASRARMHSNSVSRMNGGGVQLPQSRPSTPSDNPVALRLTMPSMSRLKSRPSISGIFPPPTPPLPPTPPANNVPAHYRPSSRASTSTSAPTKSSRRPKRRDFGDGTELDAFEDLPTDRDKEAKFRVQPKAHQNRIPGGTFPKIEKDTTKGTIRRRREAAGTPDSVIQPAASSISLKHKQSRHEGLSKNENPQKRKPSTSGPTRRKPTLIRNLGGVGAPKVVGEMRWNPQTLRWEGNDQALRDFDSASARPALITHLTGSSVTGSPAGSFGSAARIVGNMVFDPVRMCWMSTLPPDEEEPDVFAGLADDEDDNGWAMKGGTIRGGLRSNASTDAGFFTDASRKTPSPAPSIAPSMRSRTQSQSSSDHGSRASLVFDLEDNFVELCRAAESRHRVEMKGWTLSRNNSYVELDRSCLYEIRALATRQY